MRYWCDGHTAHSSASMHLPQFTFQPRLSLDVNSGSPASLPVPWSLHSPAAFAKLKLKRIDSLQLNDFPARFGRLTMATASTVLATTLLTVGQDGKQRYGSDPWPEAGGILHLMYGLTTM